MAILYVDTDGTGAATPYNSWATAAQGLEAALEDAACVAGSTIYMQGAAADATSGIVVLTSAGTVGNPVLIVGVKDGTTAAPPTNADVVVRGVDTLPIYRLSTAGNDLTFAGHARVHGIDFDIPDRMLGNFWHFHECIIGWGGFMFFNGAGMHVYWNCQMNPGAIGATHLPRDGATFKMIGGDYSGSAMTRLIDGGAIGGFFEWRGVDLSAMGANLADGSEVNGGRYFYSACKMPTSFSLDDGQGAFQDYEHIAVGCSAAVTAKTSGESFIAYVSATYMGDVSADSGESRTGGASDGKTGGWSYAMTPNANATRESVLALKGPWMPIWVDGDGTNKTFTIYIANDGAADYNDDDVSLEILFPDESGQANHEVDLGAYPSEIIPDDSPPPITDDTGSTWTSASNHQKLQVTGAPDFSGMAYCRVNFWKNFPDVPSLETLYVDPKIEVT